MVISILGEIEGFVEIADPRQEDRVCVARLHREVLL